ncbi:nitroreductase [Alkalihalobacillus sp. MEB130]|uniref:nitroreductase family protein n=1 Tax=Alkalihalobacillus sp. MEB130 TaxID=2976704 RepID=UPI0028DDF9AD|nr:nitroreductase [Alkalihalobacillus sp. MEB130]MDT8861560.1 nitroreductase [Alkalihalobacillus sp. MEB130]
MDIKQAILTRRTIGLVKDDPIPTEWIKEILHAGTFAPNHYRTEPWRFFVLQEKARNRLGDVFAEVTKTTLEDPTSDDSKKKLERSKSNPLRAPVIIAVGVEPSTKKNVLLKEEYAAVHSAVQNMLLTAHSLGLGAIWRTGALCYADQVRDFLGLSERGEVVAFIYLGYPNMETPQVIKSSYQEVTTWLQ